MFIHICYIIRTNNLGIHKFSFTLSLSFCLPFSVCVAFSISFVHWIGKLNKYNLISMWLAIFKNYNFIFYRKIFMQIVNIQNCESWKENINHSNIEIYLLLLFKLCCELYESYVTIIIRLNLKKKRKSCWLIKLYTSHLITQKKQNQRRI